MVSKISWTGIPPALVLRQTQMVRVEIRHGVVYKLHAIDVGKEKSNVAAISAITKDVQTAGVLEIQTVNSLE
ncbi:hypothetical protein EYZ11_001809 [Aspergillus tanneri]|uniref:Uncharacterized protein n=1 Tax=Aspergillus tanneri TaxID=1220188 RepID=A0A4S3JSM6_9EURO|nr:hypothetical protein EYZ11_001809 [Aspergillus tanneri]